MTAVLRFVYDQPDPVQDPEQAWVQRCLLDALGQASPRGCEVAAILPAGVEAPERARSERTSLARRELVTAWQLGAGRPGAGGMIHASSLVAPLVRHDRAHANEQTVVTLWDLQAWEEKGELSRSALSAQRACCDGRASTRTPSSCRRTRWPSGSPSSGGRRRGSASSRERLPRI